MVHVYFVSLLLFKPVDQAAFPFVLNTFLAGPLDELAIAHGAELLRGIELVRDRDVRERWLRRRAVAFRLGLGLGLGLRLWNDGGPALAGWAEEDLLALGEDLADALQLGDDGGIVSLLVGQLRFASDDGLAHRRVELEEAANLGVLGESGSPEDFDSGLSLEVDQAENLSVVEGGR